MKKILVITPFFFPHVGGSERYMEELYVSLLVSHDDVQVDVLCYNTDKSADRELYRGIQIIRIPCWQVIKGQFCLPDPLSLLRFLFSKQAKSYDLIHTSTRFFDSSWWAPVYARLTKRPVWLTDHCASFPAHPNKLIQVLAAGIDRLTGRVFLPLYDRVFVVSKQTGAFLRKEFDIDTQLIYAGVDTKFFYPVEHKVGKKVRIVYVGRMIASKGIEDLFEVARLMPECDFVMAGPGKLGEYLQERAASEKLTHVTILPGLTRKETVELLQSADIFVHPSRHSEGIPLVLLEAGSCALPVIATDVGGVREIIEEAVTGILVPPCSQQILKEALEKFSANQAWHKQLGQALRKSIQKDFRWERAVSGMYSI